MGDPGMNQDFGMQEPTDVPEMGGEKSGIDDELEGVLSRLSPEQRDAVKKYAQGIADEDGDNDEPQMDEEGMVTEITNNILDDGNPRPEDEEDNKVRNKRLNKSPFKSKYFRK